jgi:hypothetical protein
MEIMTVTSVVMIVTFVIVYMLSMVMALSELDKRLTKLERNRK